MKSSYRSVVFYIGQKELEMQYKMNRIVAQCRQKCEVMQEKFTEKLEQVHAAYQKMGKKCQIMEQEIENLSKDKQELQEKFAEKSRSVYQTRSNDQCPHSSLFSIQDKPCSTSGILCNMVLRCQISYYFPLTRQKRKLDEMYDQLRSEYDSVKRSAIQPANNFYSRTEPDMFSNTASMMDNRDSLRKGNSVPFTYANIIYEAMLVWQKIVIWLITSLKHYKTALAL